MEFLVIGVVVAANIVFIKMKFDKGRFEDAIFDSILLAIVTLLFSGSYAGLVVATIASLLISIFLFASPPKFFSGENGLFAKFKERAQPRRRFRKEDL